MFNLNGIKYRIFAVGLLFLCVSILVLIISKFWNAQIKDKRGVLIGIVALVFSATVICYYGYMLCNPLITCHEGYFVRENRNSVEAPPLPFTNEFCFSSEDGPKQIFYLDVFSRKQIYDNQFEEGKKYRIYFENRKNIIVRVEEID